jgi:hypothetical protein
MSASRGNGAAQALPPSDGAITDAAEAAKKSRRVIVMAWFPKLCRRWERFANLPHQSPCGNRHGESIVIDAANA